MSTEMPSPQTSGSRGRDALRLARLREENRALMAELKRLRTALEGAARENAELRREVARLRTETEHLGGTSRIRGSDARTAYADRMARIRVMLKDQHSRNP